MIIYDPKDFERDLTTLAGKIRLANGLAGLQNGFQHLYGVPRGGVPVAVGISSKTGIPLTANPEAPNTLIIDDLVDSGKTMEKFGDKPFACLHIKPHSPRPLFFAELIPNEWIKYFWENDEDNPVQDNLVRCLEYIGEDPRREGLLETPDRVMRSWDELYAGYKQSPEDVFKHFDGDGAGGLVYLKNIEFYSTCEHHMLPFWGIAMIAYIPDGRVIGVSKLARLLDVFARRLQIQERIAEQVTGALMEYLNPVGAACLLEAKHLCIACRGVKKQGSVMGYSSLKGVFLEHNNAGIAARNELMALWARA